MLAGNALCRATSGRDQKRAFKDQWVLRRIKSSDLSALLNFERHERVAGRLSPPFVFIILRPAELNFIRYDN